MQLNNKKVLVTGADGFIGSHLAEELTRIGCRVKAFVLYNSFNSWGWLDRTEPSILDGMEIVAGDVRDPHGVKTTMRGCDLVFHLAALIAIPYSYHSPDTYIDTNIKGTLNILQAAREAEVEKVIHTSTSEVYGTAKFVPITEDHPLQGQSPYSASKIGADHLALSFYHSFNVPVGVIRPFNTYGPRQSARAVIPTIITQIRNGQRRLRLGNTRPTRDFNYISDTVRGFISFAESDRSIGEIINIGSNFEISIERTAELIAKQIGVAIEMESDVARIRPAASEVERLWADNSKAKALLGWEPQYGGEAGLRRGLDETIAWFNRPENLQRYKATHYNI